MSAARKSPISFSVPAQPATGELPVSVRLLEARRAFERYHASCFWSSPVSLVIDADLIPWVAAGLRKHGDREAFAVAHRLLAAS